MKLSEAIRLGSMLGPQARGSLERPRRKYVFFGPVVKEYCALGAAFEASGSKPCSVVATTERMVTPFRGQPYKVKAGETISYMNWPNAWNAVMWAVVPCPECRNAHSDKVDDIIPHLNDQFRWTRERIADWVETIEAQHESQSVIEAKSSTVPLT